MEKRGQVTTYVLIGVIIVFLIAAVAYTRLSSEKPQLHEEIAMPQTAADLKSFISSCLQNTIETAVLSLGAQSGFYPVPENTESTPLGDIPVAFDVIKQLPQEHELKKNLASFIEDALPTCLDFSKISSIKILSQEEPKASVTLTDSQLSAKVLMKINVLDPKSKSQLNLDTFSASVQTTFLKLYKTADQILDEHSSDPFTIPLTKLADTGYKIDVYTVNEKTLLYHLQDQSVLIKNQPQSLLFLVKLR